MRKILDRPCNINDIADFVTEYVLPTCVCDQRVTLWLDISTPISSASLRRTGFFSQMRGRTASSTLIA